MGLLGLIPVVGELLDKVIADPDKKLELKLELAKLADAEALRESQERIAQTEVNKVEAGHRSVFVAGWRPAMGWVGASALVMIYIVQPAVNLWHGQPVGIDTSELMVLIGGMLGFGGLRSYDKQKGTANDHLPLTKANEPVAQLPKKEKKKVLGVEWPF